MTLLKNDRYSSVGISLTPKDPSLAGIGCVTLVPQKNHAFDLLDLGAGEIEIFFKDHNPGRNLKAGTVKLNVFLEGNSTLGTTRPKPNAVISIKVKIG